MSGPASDHLLRTLAAVAPGASVLLLDDDGRHAQPLRALGFEVASTAAGAGSHDWVVLWCSDGQDLPRRIGEAGAALVPGGWVWVAATDVPTPDDLEAAALEAGLALAEAPARDRLGDLDVVRGVFRRVGPGVRG